MTIVPTKGLMTDTTTEPIPVKDTANESTTLKELTPGKDTLSFLLGPLTTDMVMGNNRQENVMFVEKTGSVEKHDRTRILGAHVQALIDKKSCADNTHAEYMAKIDIALERFDATEIESKIQATQIKTLQNVICAKNKIIATLQEQQRTNGGHTQKYDDKMNMV